MKQLNTQPVMEFTENYRSKWADPDHVHVHRMLHSKISLEILGYQPKGRRFLRTSFKRLYETKRCHWI